MRAPLAAFLIPVLVLLTAADASLPSDYAVLPVSQGPALIRQCSRGGPANVSGYWSPSSAQVLAIEQRLPKFLSKSGHKSVLIGSRRQYIGVISHGKKLIYLNAFPSSVGPRTNWRTIAFTVCDGGDVFWGVEFDPIDHTFRNIQFNGVA